MKRLAIALAGVVLAVTAVACDDTTPDISPPDALGISDTDMRFIECIDRIYDWVDMDNLSLTGHLQQAFAVYCTELVLNHPNLDTGPWIDEWPADPDRHYPRRP